MLTSSNADPAFKKNGFFTWKNAMEKEQAFQKQMGKKQGFLSDLKTHIARFPDGEFFRKLFFLSLLGKNHQILQIR